MKIVISGFYGSLNTGDEAILSAILSLLEIRYKDPDVTVLSLAPKNVIEMHNVHTLLRPDPGPRIFSGDYKRMIKAVRTADLVIIGGGGLLQDAHSRLSIFRYLQTAILAKHFGTKVVLFAVGVGPIRNSINKRIVRQVCELVDVITVRDNKSKSILRQVGISDDKVMVCADPVYQLSPATEPEAEEILNQEGIEIQEKTAVVSVREYGLTENRKKELAAFFDYLISSEGYRIVFIPFGWGAKPDDLEVSNQIRSHMSYKTHSYVVSNRYHPREILGILMSANFVVGMRLHSVIMSSIGNIPALGISYLPKVEIELKRLGYKENEIIEDTKDITKVNLIASYENIVQRVESQGLLSTIDNNVKEFKQEALTPLLIAEATSSKQYPKYITSTIGIQTLASALVLTSIELLDMSFEQIKTRLLPSSLGDV